MDWQDHFKGKKVTVIGLGSLGRGIGDVKFLAEEGADLIVTDLKTEEQLKESVELLKGFSNIRFVLGKHELDDFKGRDFILKAAGVPLDSPYIAEAKKNNIPVEMSTALFAAHTQAMIIGITGTRGKSTVTHLLHDVLKKAYEGKDKKVFLGGNIRGVATLPFLREAKKGDIAVLELDSWQLQGFGERKISPHISLFTTFLPDHLNYYHGDMDRYLEDKANIFKYQDENDSLILGSQAEVIIREKYQGEISAKIVVADTKDVPWHWHMRVPGLHNRYNAAMVLAATDLLGIDRDIVRKAVEEFPGVPGRLQYIREVQGVKIFNDTTSTTPDALLAGLRAFNSKKNVVLIMGGADKQLDFSKVFKELAAHAKAVVLLAGTGSSRIEHDLMNVADIQKEKAESLDEAVAKGMSLCAPGDNLLFSPGFASFGMFRNEFDRGDKFIEIINKL